MCSNESGIDSKRTFTDLPLCEVQTGRGPYALADVLHIVRESRSDAESHQCHYFVSKRAGRDSALGCPSEGEAERCQANPKRCPSARRQYNRALGRCSPVLERCRIAG